MRDAGHKRVLDADIQLCALVVADIGRARPSRSSSQDTSSVSLVANCTKRETLLARWHRSERYRRANGGTEVKDRRPGPNCAGHLHQTPFNSHVANAISS